MLLPVVLRTCLPESVTLKTKYTRCGTKQKNMSSNDHMGSLNEKLLKRMGLTQKQMEDGDVLFFYQLFLPICNPDKSGIRDDPHKTFYNVASKYTHKYSILIRSVVQTMVICSDLWMLLTAELVNFDGIVFQNGNWYICDDDPDVFDSAIADNMSHCRFIDLQSNFKLHDNSTEIKQGMKNDFLFPHSVPEKW